MKIQYGKIEMVENQYLSFIMRKFVINKLGTAFKIGFITVGR